MDCGLGSCNQRFSFLGLRETSRTTVWLHRRTLGLKKSCCVSGSTKVPILFWNLRPFGGTDRDGYSVAWPFVQCSYSTKRDPARLTIAGCPVTLKEMLPSSGQLPSRRVLPWVCVLLAFLLLYNPFVLLFHSHSESSVHSLARNRATIGSSELQHYSPVSSASILAALLLQVVGILVAIQKTEVFPEIAAVHSDSILGDQYNPSLYFRPPPSY